MKNKCSTLAICLTLMLFFNNTGFAETYIKYSILNSPLSIFDGNEYKTIQAYEIEGVYSPLICAEELENYGFSVTWKPKKRCTVIEYTGTQNKTPKTIPLLSEGRIYESDVKIFINNVEMKSYNIGGYSLISIYDFYTVHSLQFSGTMPSNWSKEYVLDASFNDIFDFFYTSLDYYTNTCSIYPNHKEGVVYQNNITVSEFCDLLNAFVKLLQEKSPHVDPSCTLPIQQAILCHGTSLNCDASTQEVTRENASVMLINALQYMAAPLELETDHLNTFNTEPFNSNALESSKLAYENGIFTLDTQGLFNPTSKVSFEQTLVLLSKLGYKYEIFNKRPRYDIQNSRTLESFPKSDLDKNIYLINDFSKPVKLPPVEGINENRYLCNVTFTDKKIIIDATAQFVPSPLLLGYSPMFEQIKCYSNGEVLQNTYMYDITDYLGNGIIRYEIPLPIDKDQIQKVIINAIEFGPYEIGL